MMKATGSEAKRLQMTMKFGKDREQAARDRRASDEFINVYANKMQAETGVLC